ELLNHALKSIKDETKGSFLIALKELNSNLNSPIDNDIQRFIVVNKDTIVNEENEKLVKIYFFYTTNIKKRDTLFSRISIYREKPTLELFNAKSTGNSEYQNFDPKDIELEYSAF